MYLLDTNVLSETRRVRPHGGVTAWLKSVAARDLHLAAVSLAEVQSGIEATRARDPGKAAQLETWLDTVEATWTVIAMDGGISSLGATDAQAIGRAL